MDRREHLDWAKTRALGYVLGGDCHEAVVSFMNDLRKHPQLDSHPGIALAGKMLAEGQLDTASKVRKFLDQVC